MLHFLHSLVALDEFPVRQLFHVDHFGQVVLKYHASIGGRRLRSASVGVGRGIAHGVRCCCLLMIGLSLDDGGILCGMMLPDLSTCSYIDDFSPTTSSSSPTHGNCEAWQPPREIPQQQLAAHTLKNRCLLQRLVFIFRPTE